MVRLGRARRFAIVAAVAFVVFASPLPNPVYGTWFRGVVVPVFDALTPSFAIEIQRLERSEPDTRLVVHDRRLGLRWEMECSSWFICGVPLAIVLALLVATRTSPRRWSAIGAASLVLVHAYVLIRLALVVEMWRDGARGHAIPAWFSSCWRIVHLEPTVYCLVPLLGWVLPAWAFTRRGRDAAGVSTAEASELPARTAHQL